MRGKNVLHFAVLRLFLFASVLLFAVQTAQASTATLGGTIRDSSGNLFNGRVTFMLPVSATDTTTGAAILPTPVTYAIRNGTFPPNSTLEDTTTLSPANLYYTAYLYDATGSLISIANYAAVTGNPFDFGLAIPVAVTTSNITFLNPASLSLIQSWLTQQNFTAGISVGASGSSIGKILLGSATLTYTAIAAVTCQEQTLTIAGAAATAVPFVAPSTNLANTNLSWSVRMSGVNTAQVRVCNPTAGMITPTAVPWVIVTVQ